MNQITQNLVSIDNLKCPSSEDRKIAKESYNTLLLALENLKIENPKIEIENTQRKIKIPKSMLKIVLDILKAVSEGKLISIVSIATKMNTQEASEFLGYSQVFLNKLLENGNIPFSKKGKYKRVKFEDVIHYKENMKRKQKELIIKTMKSDEELGLYEDF